MKTSRQIFLWLAVVLMLCAAVSIGCGSSSDDSDQEQADSPTDETTGRNEGWESLMSFKEFSGTWEIYTINMGLNRNTVFENEPLPITRFRLTATPTEDGGYLETFTLDGQKFGDISSAFRNEIYGVLENIVILSSGSYEFTNKGALCRTKTYSNYDDSQGNDKYLVQTVLHRIPDDTVEGLGLVSGNWKIVSASLQVRVSKIDYALYDWNDDFNPNITLIPKGDMLAWSYDASAGNNYSPLKLQSESAGAPEHI